MKRIAQSIVAFIISIFGANAGKVIGIFLISLLPVIELRGSIPVGYYQGLPWYTNMITSIIGNLLPVPFILLFVVKVFEFMKKRNIMVGFIEKIEKDEKLVALTSLYIHLMDQFDWELLSKKIVEEECLNILRQITNLLEFDFKEIEKKYMKKENEDFLEYLTDNFIFMLAKFVEAKWRE